MSEAATETMVEAFQHVAWKYGRNIDTMNICFQCHIGKTLSKLITLVDVPINYHIVPTYLIISANGINTQIIFDKI